ncbi:MAG: NfeD family protein [Mariprofundales bacterium]|nr:NfeD family protein [Mariprofundales bacterium]
MEAIAPSLIWGVVGAALIVIEVFSSTFVALCIGLGALTAMVSVLIAPELSLVWQLVVWGISTTIYTVLFFTVLKPRMRNETTAGDPLLAVCGQCGRVASLEDDARRGTIEFTQPLLGNRTWHATSDTPLVLNQDAIVDDVDGNSLIVHPVPTHYNNKEQ